MIYILHNGHLVIAEVRVANKKKSVIKVYYNSGQFIYLLHLLVALFLLLSYRSREKFCRRPWVAVGKR